MRKKLLRLVRLAPLTLAFIAGAAYAQTTGTIIGVVTDASTGKAVPDALVVATSPNLQGEQTALTDDTGAFRIPLLPAGRYKLAVQREGYNPAERGDIDVHLDKTLRANIAIVPSAVKGAEITVSTGTAPVINVGTATAETSVTKDFIANVPVSKDFEGTAIVAPGAQGDLYGISFNGASSPENNYILDGMNVTDPAFGILGSQLLNNFVEEVDVKSSGFMPEYGRATGGIINVVTKSGSNEFHGSVFGDVTPGALSPSSKVISQDAAAIATKELQSKGYAADFGAEVGGPIMKDRLWFYVGFAPVLAHSVTDRYIQHLVEDPNNPGHAEIDASTGMTKGVAIPGTDTLWNSDATQYQFTSKLTYLLNENNNVALSFYTAPNSQSLPMHLNGTTDNLNLSGTSSDTILRYAGKLLDKHLIVEAQGGWHHQRNEYDPTAAQKDTSAVRWQLQHPLTDFEVLSGQALSDCTPTATFNPCPVYNFTTGGVGYFDTVLLDRYNGKISASGLFEAAGHHNVKAGIDIERASYDHTKGYSGTRYMRERSSGTFGTYFQDYRSYGTVDASGTPHYDTTLHVASITDSKAFYVQDSWSIGDQLTINGGVRWEMQDMYEQGVSGPANLNISDNIGPRVQAIYDFTGQGKSKISANWGRFYESIPLDMGDRSFGGETQVLAARTGCVSASPTVGGAPSQCDVIPNYYSSSGYLQIGGGVVPVAPDLKGQYVDQFGGDAEYEVATDLSVGVSYSGARLGRVIEDMSTDDGQNYFIANPSESKPWDYKDPSSGAITHLNPQVAASTYDYTSGAYLHNITEPAPIRRYDGVTLEAKKNFSKHWLGDLSYTYSSFRGNYPGLFRSENGQLDPNILSEYDLVTLLPNKFGPLPGDTPHAIKAFGSYVWDVGPRLNVITGAALRAHSGSPISILGAHPDYGPGEAFVMPRGMGGRTPFVTALDLKGGLEYTVVAPYTVRFEVNLFNVLNQQQTLSVDENYTYDSVKPVVNGQCTSKNGAEGTDPIAGVQKDCPDLAYLKTTDGRPVTVNKNFGRATAYQAPLSVRFGLTVTF